MGMESGGRPVADLAKRQSQDRANRDRRFREKLVYYMGFAAHAASESKDSKKVGAALVGPEGEVRMTGYNGPPRGVRDIPERFVRPAKYLFASHAEQNLIAFCAREGVSAKGCTLYTTNFPCAGCAKSIIQAGISTVVAYPNDTSMPAEEFEVARMMLDEAGIQVLVIPPTRSTP